MQGECEAGTLGPDLLHAARAGMIKREESLTFCEGRDLTRLWADGPANFIDCFPEIMHIFTEVMHISLELMHIFPKIIDHFQKSYMCWDDFDIAWDDSRMILG